MRHVFSMVAVAAGLVWILTTAGCAKKNTFVLLPDPDGTLGEITVRTDKGTQVINQAQYAVQVTSTEEPPSPPKKMDADTIEKKFGMALAADPGAPVTFNLYFKRGTDQLTSDSEARIPDILATIVSRKSKDISVVGHTDRVGAEDVNLRLSKDRARTLKDLLVSRGVDPDIIFVTAHGETDLLIPTADGVPEPRNRRVEVTIR